MMKPSSLTKTKLLVLALFLIAGVMRLINWSHLNTIAGDEGVQLLTAEHLIKYGVIPTMGEISALDTDNEYLMHNSPLGYYFLTLIYLLGFRTVEGYVLIFVFLNLIQAYLLYQATKLFFGQRASLAVLALALFSPNMFYAAVWPSQPVMAIFFESIALFLVAKFIKNKKDNFFVSATLISLLATQFYPPMYLLLPAKIGLYWLGLQKIKKRGLVIALTLFSAFLIYLPMVQIELRHDWTNLQTLSNYLQNPSSETTTDPLQARLVASIKQVFAYIFPALERQIVLFVASLMGVILSVYLASKNWQVQKKFIGLFLLWFSPALLLSLVIKSSYPIFDRAYLFIVIPFLFVWLGTLLGKLNKKLFLSAMILMVIFLTLPSLNRFQFKNESNNIQKVNSVATAILSDLEQRSLQLSDLDLLAISNYDPYGWETSFYWYALEKMADQYLVDIDINSSKAVRRSITPLEVLYVICHRVQENFSHELCLKNFENQIDGKYYRENFVLESTIGSLPNPIMVMRVEK